MTGLDKIIDRINEDSQNSVKSITAEAKLEADRIISEAEAAADEREAAVLEDAEKRANSISERAASSADIEIKRKILSKKQEIIANTIKDAKQKLKELDDEKYFDVVGKLLVKYKTGDAGEIVFSAKDKKRIPKDFDFCGLSVSEKDGDFDGGFVLVYGNIEINCTFDALFEGAYDELSDMVNKIMFGSC